jgi:hypothetical protein
MGNLDPYHLKIPKLDIYHTIAKSMTCGVNDVYLTFGSFNGMDLS